MSSLQVMGQYDDVKCTLVMCVLHDNIIRGCDHHNTVNRIEICLKTRYHAIPVSKFVVKYTIEGSFVCHVESRVVEAMVA